MVSSRFTRRRVAGDRARPALRSPRFRALALAAFLIAAALVATPAARASGCAEGPAVTRADTLPRLAPGRIGPGLRILAIGSSSTFGTGATTPQAAYPARLEALLRAAAGREDVAVVNAGVPGETADATLERLERALAAERFDLAIWQVGTNDALRGVPAEVFAGRLERGVALAQGAGVPLLVVDPQFFPGIPDRAAYERTVALVAELAAVRGVAVLRRYDVMRGWGKASAERLGAMLSADRFHMSDAGYACLAALIAEALVAKAEARAVRPAADAAGRGPQGPDEISARVD